MPNRKQRRHPSRETIKRGEYPFWMILETERRARALEQAEQEKNDALEAESAGSDRRPDES